MVTEIVLHLFSVLFFLTLVLVLSQACSQFSVYVTPLKIQVALVGPWASLLLAGLGGTALFRVQVW